MSNKSRGHHFLSQCYLKGFTADGVKTTQLAVIDGAEKKAFRTAPANVGKVRDFNRVNVEGVDQNALEDKLSEFETDAANAIAELDAGQSFEGERREIVLSLIALFAVRTPHMREVWRQNMASLAEHIMDVALHSKEMWEHQIASARADGVELSEDVTYEQVKDFVERREYEIGLSTDHHICMESVGLDAISPHLFNRNWRLFRSPGKNAPFITSEKPVSLVWTEAGEKNRFPPGYGLRGTSVNFPLSRNLYLIGEFDGPDDEVVAGARWVAYCNEFTMSQATGRLFAPSFDFSFMAEGDVVANGHALLQRLDIPEP